MTKSQQDDQQSSNKELKVLNMGASTQNPRLSEKGERTEATGECRKQESHQEPCRDRGQTLRVTGK